MSLEIALVRGKHLIAVEPGYKLETLILRAACEPSEHSLSSRKTCTYAK